MVGKISIFFYGTGDKDRLSRFCKGKGTKEGGEENREKISLIPSQSDGFEWVKKVIPNYLGPITDSKVRYLSLQNLFYYSKVFEKHNRTVFVKRDPKSKKLFFLKSEWERWKQSGMLDDVVRKQTSDATTPLFYFHNSQKLSLQDAKTVFEKLYIKLVKKTQAYKVLLYMLKDQKNVVFVVPKSTVYKKTKVIENVSIASLAKMLRIKIPYKNMDENFIFILAKCLLEDLVDSKSLYLINPMDSRGPIKNSNWIIKNKLLIGPYPSTMGDLKALMYAGVNVFVSLLEYGEEKWKWDLPSYTTALNKYKGITQMQYPIKDGDAPTKKDLTIVVSKIHEMLDENRIIYLHCYAGIQRSGSIIIALLMKYFSMRYETAAKYLRDIYSVRQKKSKKFISKRQQTLLKTL